MIPQDSGRASRSIAGACEALENGKISPEVAAVRALFAGGSVRAAIDLLGAVRPPPGSATYAAIATRLTLHRAKCDAMAAFYGLSGTLPVSGMESDSVAATARFFDNALRISPEASVAPHSLGSSSLLARTTEELVHYLIEGKFLGQRRRTLELGCGNGRMQCGIAPYVLEAAGVDVSADMIEAARRRRRGYAGVRFFNAPAHRLSDVGDAEYHLVFAVDSFPYIVNAGDRTVAATFSEMRRILRHDGDVLIFNYSYRGDEARDRSDLVGFGAAVGLDLLGFSSRPFKHWDGSVFHLRRVAGD